MTVSEMIKTLEGIENKDIGIYMDIEDGEVYEIKNFILLDDGDGVVLSI